MSDSVGHMYGTYATVAGRLCGDGIPWKLKHLTKWMRVLFGGACVICGGVMRKVSIRLTDKHYEMLEQLVIEGEYASVSEAIRDAIRRLLQEKADIIERSRNLSSYR